MTIWLEESTVRQSIIDPTDADGEIVGFTIEDGRCTAKVRFYDEINLTSLSFSEWNSFLGSIGDGDPEINIYSENNNTIVEVVADENVYRE